MISIFKALCLIGSVALVPLAEVERGLAAGMQKADSLSREEALPPDTKAPLAATATAQIRQSKEIPRQAARFSATQDHDKNTEATDETVGSIADELSRDPSLAPMNRLLNQTEMMEQFRTGMQATVFVPKSELLDSAGSIETDAKKIQELMQYHIVFGELTDDWFRKDTRVLTQRKIDNNRVSVGVSVDQSGTKLVNGIAVLRTLEAANGRICWIDGILEPPVPRPVEESDFAEALRSRKGYRKMAELMDSQKIQAALQQVKAATVFAVPDDTLAALERGGAELEDYAIKNLIVPGRYDRARLSQASTRWLLPIGDSGPTSGWAVRANEESEQFKLYQIGPEGLPAKEVVVVESDIDAGEGMIHLLEGLPKTPSMTRGGLLELDVCRDILQSAMERSDIRKSRGEMELSIAILEAVFDGQSAATFDTAAIYKDYLSTDFDKSDLPKFVPARTFTILNSAFAAGLSIEESEMAKRHQIFRSGLELARLTLDPKAVAGTRENTALPTLRDQFNSYREAVDLARYTLRLRGLPDKSWLGDRNLFEPSR